MVIFSLSWQVRQWSPGRDAAIMLSPKISTVLFPTVHPTRFLHTGLGIQRIRDIASANAGLLRPSGPGRHESQAEDNLSRFRHAITALVLVLITAPLHSSLSAVIFRLVLPSVAPCLAAPASTARDQFIS